ncbi:DUF3899 domain-containing protein [Neobacillus niacini]|uniref:DUF3899 domain-containing protein n=1 Tax=Neobacillus niacini TaxID=86668 RepID=UPI003983694F
MVTIMFENKWKFLAINILLTLIFFLIFADDYNLLHFINALFYLCFTYLIVVLFMYTRRGGFFDGVTFGFRRFKSIMFNRNSYLDEYLDKPLPSENFNASIYQRLKFQTIALFLLLILLLLLFYAL